MKTLLKMKHLLYRTLLLLPFVFIMAGKSNGQRFANKALLEVPDSSGFYGIDITPQFSAFIKTDLADVRILNEAQKQVPFVVRDAAWVFIHSRFDTLPIIRNEVTDSGRSIIVVQNKTRGALTGMALVIKNADVQRNATLSGSNDGKNWFTIVENIYLSNTVSSDKDVYMQQITFPLSSYHYFRLSIDNNKNAPLNIVAAVRTTEESFKAVDPYVENPGISFIQKDSSDNYSYIFLNNTQGFHIAKVAVEIKGPKFFKRQVSIETGAFSYSYTMETGMQYEFVVPVFKDKKWSIRIYNGDNPPLTIASVKTWQSRKQLVTYLEAGKQHELVFNDLYAHAPAYELQNFQDSIPANVKMLTPGPVEKVMTDASDEKKEGNKVWLWITLGALILVLLYFTIRLVKDMRNS